MLIATGRVRAAGGPTVPPSDLRGWLLLGLLAVVVAVAVVWSQWYRQR